MGGEEYEEYEKQREPTTSRRSFLAGAAVGAGAVLAPASAAAYINSPDDGYRKELTRDGDVARLYGRHSDHTIFYGSHDTPEDDTALFADLDGVHLEAVGPYIDALEQGEPLMENFHYDVQYAPFMDILAENDVSVYLGDLHFTTDAEELAKTEIKLGVGEMMIGNALIVRGAYDAYTAETLGDDVQSGTEIAAGAWLGMPTSANIAMAEADTDLTTELAAEYGKLTDRVHPEDMFHAGKIRNVAVAHKMEWVAQTQHDDHPHIGSVWGARHTGFEDALQYSPDHRCEFLDNREPVWQHTVDPDYLYRIARFDHNGDDWEHTATHAIPDLEDVVTG